MNKEIEDIETPEYHALLPNESENYRHVKVAHDSNELGVERNNDMDANGAGQWANTNTIHRHRHQPILQKFLSNRALLLVGHSAFLVVERFLIFAGFGQFLIGIVTYSGKTFIFMSLETPITFL